MATLKINGDTSGYVELVSPAVAGSTSLELDKIVVEDNSGNVLVGKSAASKDIIGAELKPDGRINATMASGSPLLLNRKTSDGDIAVFQKDNTTVGSIASKDGDVAVGTGGVGLRFGQNNSDQLTPHSMTTNSGKDAAVILGSAGARFKDLYLSGGIYLGGTGPDNLMSEYETGTFTPFFSHSNTTADIGSSYGMQTGVYVKVGRLVYFAFDMSANIGSTAGNVAYLRGLPFTPAADGRNPVPTMRDFTCVTVPSGRIVKPFVVASVTGMHIGSDSLTNGAASNVSAFNSSGRANMTGVYLADE